MPRFKITFRCQLCGGKFSKIVADPGKAKLKCQNLACRHVQVPKGFDPEGHAPGIVGASNVTRAIDKTAEIVMRDYGMTNLKDNIREGDSVVVPLSPQQQRMADGFFGGKAIAERAGINRRQMDLLGRRAIAGAFRHMAADPGQITPNDSVALRPVRTTT